MLSGLFAALVWWMERNKNKIMAKVSELAGQLAPIVTALNDVGAQLGKATAEILKAVQDNDPEIPAAVTEKIEALNGIAAALKSAAQSLDDLNPDEPTPPAA